MTRVELEQLRKLPNEIRILEKELEAIKPQIVTDSVVGSSPHFPYTKHVMKIIGIDMEKIERMRGRIERKIEKLTREVDRLNDYIEAIEDSEIRQIMILRYRMDCHWYTVAKEMGRAGDGSTERKKHDRYINFPAIPE